MFAYSWVEEQKKCFIDAFVLRRQAVSTVYGDNSRFNERIAQLKARPKTEWVPKPWPPKSKCAASTDWSTNLIHTHTHIMENDALINHCHCDCVLVLTVSVENYDNNGCKKNFNCNFLHWQQGCLGDPEPEAEPQNRKSV